MIRGKEKGLNDERSGKEKFLREKRGWRMKGSGY